MNLQRYKIVSDAAAFHVPQKHGPYYLVADVDSAALLEYLQLNSLISRLKAWNRVMRCEKQVLTMENAELKRKLKQRRRST